MNDAERAAARELFRQGDELQRAGRFTDALDKFQRAQQVFSAPTNMLRIAECDAALGRLVESAEAYREVVRTPLPPGAPSAFQAAVDQARAELGQVEPRVPKLVVQVPPPLPGGLQMQIDGQNVPAALVGEPVPLDPGPHKVLLLAPGYASSEQQVVLKEHDSKALAFTLKPVAGVTYAPGGAAEAVGPTTAPEGPAAGSVPPPPPPMMESGVPAPPPKSRTGFLLGGHLGWDFAGGSLPTGAGTPIDTTAATGSGVAIALDGGIRFARQWVAGLTLEHAELGNGSLTGLGSISKSNGNTSLLAVVLGLIGNPERTSFYGEVGLGNRWFAYTTTDSNNNQNTTRANAGEVILGAGIWIPAGKKLRLLPKITIDFGRFDSSAPAPKESETHAFVMLGVAGYYNVDL